MAFIEILDGDLPKQTALYASDCMTVKTAEKGRRSYWMKEATVSVVETARDKRAISFDLQLRDGKNISCSAIEKVFDQLKGFAKESSDLNYIAENKSGEDIRKTKKEVIAALIAGGLILWVLGGFLFSSGEEKERTVEDEKINALINCQLLVKANLKSPATAKFPRDAIKGVTVTEEDQMYTVRSYVDAQNSYGGLMRTEYGCILIYAGGGKHGWELVDLKIQ